MQAISMKLILQLSVSVILMGIIVWQLGGIKEVAQVITEMSPIYALVVLVVATADRSLMTFKWAQLLRGRGLYLPFFHGMKIYCASMVWGTFLPASIGADAIRVIATSRVGFDSNEVVASILIERIIGFFSALLLGLLSLYLLSQVGGFDAYVNSVWLIASAMLGCLTILFLVSFSKVVFDFIIDRLLRRFRDTWLIRRLQEFHLVYRGYQKNKGTLAMFLGLTFFEQLIPILYAWLIARGLGVEVGLLYFAVAMPLAILISRLPISIDGLGVFDGIFMILLSLGGVPPEQAIGITLVGRILQIASWLPWWIAYMIDTGTIGRPRTLIQER